MVLLRINLLVYSRVLKESGELTQASLRRLLPKAAAAAAMQGGGKRMKAIKGVSDAFWLGGGYHWEDGMWVLN